MSDDKTQPPRRLQQIHCPYCGAYNQTAGDLCWMCLRKYDDRERVVEAQVIAGPKFAPPKFVPNTFSFSLASIFAIMTLVAVGLGLTQIEPGFGILFGMVSVPALVVTFVRTRKEQRSKGREVGWGERILTFAISSVAVFGALMVTQVALAIALIAVCLIICGAAVMTGNL